jgi:methionyl-tRNA synthetase
LVGKVVNIASRCAGFIYKQFDGVLTENNGEDEHSLWREFTDASGELSDFYEKGEYGKAMRKIGQLADRANQYIAENAPWRMIKEEGKRDEVQRVCSLGINLFRVLITYLKPVVPELAARSEAFLNQGELTWTATPEYLSNVKIAKFKPLLTRLEDSAVQKMVAAAEAEAGSTAPSTDQVTDQVADQAKAPTKLSSKSAKKDGAKGEIDFDTFAAVDMRVAEIVAASEVEGADKLLQLTLNVNEPDGKTRNVISGIKSAYSPEQLVGKLTVVVANLAPRKMRFGVSEGMVLAAGPGGPDGKEIFLISPDSGATPGMQVT